MESSQRPRKRAKIQLDDKPKHANSKSRGPFSSGPEIIKALKSEDGLHDALITLRNQFTVKSNEVTVPPNDSRILLVQSWLQLDPDAREFFLTWSGISHHNFQLASLFVAVTANVLRLISFHYMFHSLGQGIIKTLLSSSWIRKLNAQVAGSHAELNLVTLKLLYIISNFGGGRERKNLLENFAWETKSLPKLLYMRRKDGKHPVSISQPDIRTTYILFITSFVDSETPSSLKTLFIEQHRDVFLSIFKGIGQDSYSVVRHVLEICWTGLWLDPKIKRTLKIGLFNETTIVQILKLYDRISPDEESDPTSIPADVAHHFLLAICTRPGMGICFKDQGWYNRSNQEGSGDEEVERSKIGGKVHNKILANVLKSLKINEDARQQELASKILRACPELVAGYWTATALTLEPRLSTKWLANIAFLGTVISLPIPTDSFKFSSGGLYHPSPPSLTNVMENTIPSMQSRNNFTKGLQSTSAIVQHSTALALAKCLHKFGRVVSFFKTVADTLEEDNSGQWSRRVEEVEYEARRRVPDFTVIVAFSQQKWPAGFNPQKAVFLNESAQRLLWLYQTHLPGLVDEVRFDVGKVLMRFTDDTCSDNPTRLDLVRQLHILRLLGRSDQFTWTIKPSASSHSYLYIMLSIYVAAPSAVMRSALGKALREILSKSILFQNCLDDLPSWLLALPTNSRTSGTESPDGALLTDEKVSVLEFLDDCIQRCLKTPYKYIEAMNTLILNSNDNNGSEVEVLDIQVHSSGSPSTTFSPLLATVIEQLQLKSSSPKEMFSPSDCLAVTTFIRKLLYRLSLNTNDLSGLRAIAYRLSDGSLGENVSERPIMAAAIRREASIALSLLSDFLPSYGPSLLPSQSITAFLDQVEGLPPYETPKSMRDAAYELIDWIRLLQEPPVPSELCRVFELVFKLHPPALSDFVDMLPPTSDLLWTALGLMEEPSKVICRLRFDQLFTRSRLEDFSPTRRAILLKSLTQEDPKEVAVRSAIILIGHALKLYAHAGAGQTLFIFLLETFMTARVILSEGCVNDVKDLIFAVIQPLLALYFTTLVNNSTKHELHRLINAVLNAHNSEDMVRISHIISKCYEVLAGNFDSDESETLLFWIKYMDVEQLLPMLDALTSRAMESSRRDAILSEVFGAIQLKMSSASEQVNLEKELRRRISQLLRSRQTSHHASSSLDLLAARALESQMIIGAKGNLPATHSWDLPTVIDAAKSRWSSSFSVHVNHQDLSSILSSHPRFWTPTMASIFSDLIYSSLLSPDDIIQRLTHAEIQETSVEVLGILFHAIGDHLSMLPHSLSDSSLESFGVCVSRLLGVLGSEHASHELQKLCSSTIEVCVLVTPVNQTILRLLQDQVNLLVIDHICPFIFDLAVASLSLGDLSHKFVVLVVDYGLKWSVRYFSGGSNHPEIKSVLKQFALLIKALPNLKSHLVEPLLSAIVANRMNDSMALALLPPMINTSSMKPATVNKHLQSIIHHPEFTGLCDEKSPCRSAIIDILYALFLTHPSNTLQLSHVQPLIAIYAGTLSLPDRQILDICKRFENERRIPIASLLDLWTSPGSSSSDSMLGAIQGLDPVRILRMSLAYPDWRTLDGDEADLQQGVDGDSYDPVFLTLLFAHMISSKIPERGTGWVQVMRTNIVGMLIRMLSSQHAEIRQLALSQLIAFWKCLESADLQEKPHVVYLLRLLKDALVYDEDGVQRVPSYISLLLFHALRGIFYPANFIYPHTARFLLQRPVLDLKDVPMLYGMLYSSSEDWKKERAWIIRFLADGMLSNTDWQVFKRRHTWDLLASLFQSLEDKDRGLRRGILEVLANLTCQRHATAHLVLRKGLLAWLEIQLHKGLPAPDEVIAWLRVVENITIVLDAPRMERSTQGEWKRCLSRCVKLLLSDKRSQAVDICSIATPIILRLSLLPGSDNTELPSLLEVVLGWMGQLENTIERDALTSIQRRPMAAKRKPMDTPTPPYHPYRLWDVPSVSIAQTGMDSLRIWGTAVEALWRACMVDNKGEKQDDGLHNHQRRAAIWQALTGRLLIWRALVGARASPLGEWARREVMENRLRTARG